MNRLRALVISASFIACETGGGGLDAQADASADERVTHDSNDLDADGALSDGSFSEAGASAQVELATGQSEVELLSPSSPTMELVYGSQGGYHIWGRARFRGFAPDVDVWFEATEVPPAGRVLHTPVPGRRWIENGLRRGLRVEADGFYVTEPDLVVLNIRCTAEVVGRTVRVTAHVRERASGTEAVSVRDVRVIDDVPSPSCVPDA